MVPDERVEASRIYGCLHCYRCSSKFSKERFDHAGRWDRRERAGDMFHHRLEAQLAGGQTSSDAKSWLNDLLPASGAHQHRWARYRRKVSYRRSDQVSTTLSNHDYLVISLSIPLLQKHSSKSRYRFLSYEWSAHECFF